MSVNADLRALFTAGRPLVEQWLEIAEQFAALRDTAKAKGIDWSQVKALLKAQVQDETDGGSRVAKLVEKAEFASAYADMLGIGSGNLNKNNFSGEAVSASQEAPIRGEGKDAPDAASEAARLNSVALSETAPATRDNYPEMPAYLRRTETMQ